MIVKSGELKGYAEVLDLKDDERRCVDRFPVRVDRGAGQSVYWTDPREVHVERVNVRAHG